MNITAISNVVSNRNLSERNIYPQSKSKSSARMALPMSNMFIKQPSFKAAIHACAREGNWEGIKTELDKGIDINLRDEYSCTALMYAASYGKANVVEKLLQCKGINVNLQTENEQKTALMIAANWGHKEAVEKLLESNDIDISITNKYGQNAIDIAIAHGYPEIAEMIKKRADKKKCITKQETEKLDIEKLTSYKAIWSNEETQTLQKMIDKNDYKGVVKLLESKGIELNERYKQLITNIDKIKKETEQSVRETVTETIRQEEQAAAKKEYDEQNEALTNLINHYKLLLAEDVESAKVGIRALYGLEAEELPKTLDFSGQMINVINVLTKRKNKLTALNSGVAEKITKSLQNNNGNISVDGLKFLERIIDASEERCDEGSLTDSIQSVKGEGGFIDLGKAGLFVSILSMGGLSLRNVIKEVEKYAIK